VSEIEERLVDLLDDIRIELGSIASRLPDKLERRDALRAQMAETLLSNVGAYARTSSIPAAVQATDLLLAELGL